MWVCVRTFVPTYKPIRYLYTYLFTNHILLSLQIYLHVWNESTVMKVVYNSSPKNVLLIMQIRENTNMASARQAQLCQCVFTQKTFVGCLNLCYDK